MPHRWWPPQDLPDIHRLARLVREQGINIIHAHRGKDHWQAVLAAKLYRLNAPVIRTRHVVTPLKGHAANRWLARHTAALVAVSRAVYEDVERSRAYFGGRLLLIPGGIDLKLFAPASAAQRAAARAKLPFAHGQNARATIACCVARFAVVKAQRVLIRAWQRVVTALPHARLLLIGDGLLLPECQALADELGLRERVVFLGRRDDVAELLDAADAGVLSSVGSEGFSRAVLEYMAKGLPVVATRVGAVPDLLTGGAYGQIVPPDDDAALAAALTKVLGAPAAQRDEWGRAARAVAEQRYGYDSWAAAHEALYAQIMMNYER